MNSLFGLLSRDIGIDLGTANTLVLVRGKGIVINEPSVVAVNYKTKRVLAVGREAKRMLGRTPSNIVAVRPLKDGVISDFDITERMLRYFIERVHEQVTIIPRPRIVIGIPSGVTEVERRAVYDAAMSAGAREVWLIDEPTAAAIGAGLPITEPQGCMIVDIGGGTTEVAVISLGGVVANRSIRIAGDEMDQDIVTHMRQHHNLAIGERMAEEIKIAVGSAISKDCGVRAVVRGRSLKYGLPEEIMVSSEEIADAISGSVNAIVEAVIDTIDETPPELVADLMARGITVAGGGGLLRNLDELLREHTHISVHIPEDSLGCVVRGAGKVLNDLDVLRRVAIDPRNGRAGRR
ncbi:MAG: MreB/Mrl family cell shape determining protein [Chloroflexi bacterium]|nr:MreB/Mrl family cell shape determining protein [Chloroflexota bacterium]